MYQLTDGSTTEYTSLQSILLHPNHIYYGKYVHVCVFLEGDRTCVMVCVLAPSVLKDRKCRFMHVSEAYISLVILSEVDKDWRKKWSHEKPALQPSIPSFM